MKRNFTGNFSIHAAVLTAVALFAAVAAHSTCAGGTSDYEASASFEPSGAWLMPEYIIGTSVVRDEGLFCCENGIYLMPVVSDTHLNCRLIMVALIRWLLERNELSYSVVEMNFHLDPN